MGYAFFTHLMWPNLWWTCEAVPFAANEGNQYDCRRPQVPNTTHLTPADARRNDACMDAPGSCDEILDVPTTERVIERAVDLTRVNVARCTDGRTKRTANARTWAEKEQRKALWMKALAANRIASRRQHLSTQDARSAGFRTESPQGYFYPPGSEWEGPIGVYR